MVGAVAILLLSYHMATALRDSGTMYILAPGRVHLRPVYGHLAEALELALERCGDVLERASVCLA